MKTCIDTALQINESEVGAHENPVVQVFIDKIVSDIEPLFIGKENEIKSGWELYEIAEEATIYIHDIVSNALRTESPSVSHLSCVGVTLAETQTFP